MNSYHFENVLQDAVERWQLAPTETAGQSPLALPEEPDHQRYNQWLIAETIKKDAALTAVQLKRAGKPRDDNTNGWIFDSYAITVPRENNNCIRYIGKETCQVTEGVLLSHEGYVSLFKQEPDKPLQTDILNTNQLVPIGRVPKTETLDEEPSLVAEWRGRLCRLLGVKYDRLGNDNQPTMADITDGLTYNIRWIEESYKRRALRLAEQLRTTANPWNTVFGIQAWDLGSSVRVTDTPGKHYCRSGKLLTARGDVAGFTAEFTQDEEDGALVIPTRHYTTVSDFLGPEARSVPATPLTSDQRNEIDATREAFFAKAAALL